MEDDKIIEIKLYPIDLHMEKPRRRRGCPTLSKGDEPLIHISEISSKFGTKIHIENGIGTISM